MDKKEEMLIKINKCKDKLTVADAAEAFCTTWYGLEKSTDSFKDVIDKVDEKAWIKFANAILISYLSALYLNCDIDEKEQTKRVDEVGKAFASNIKAVAIARKEDPSKKTYDA